MKSCPKQAPRTEAPRHAARTGSDSSSSVQRVVSRCKTSPDVVRDIMFLFGVTYASKSAFNKAVNMARALWRDGYAIGVEMQKRKPSTMKKIKSILRGKEGG
jgi:hypothetical protein